MIDEGLGCCLVAMIQPTANQGGKIGGHLGFRIGDCGVRGAGWKRARQKQELASGDGVAGWGMGDLASPSPWGLLGNGLGLVAKELRAIEAFAWVEEPAWTGIEDFEAMKFELG